MNSPIEREKMNMRNRLNARQNRKLRLPSFGRQGKICLFSEGAPADDRQERN
jgi:hypothetical protein